MSSDNKQAGFLSRWSERKRAIAEEEENEKTSQEQQLADENEHEAVLLANREAAEAIDLDTINSESDLSVFMKEGVPQLLKKAALAKLWRSDPVFANVDGLVDYDDNFADPKLIMKTFTSAYQIGKGYLKELVEEDPASEGDTVSEPQIVETTESMDEPDKLHQEQEVEPELDTAATVDETVQEPLEVAITEVSETAEPEEPGLPKISLRKRLNV